MLTHSFFAILTALIVSFIFPPVNAMPTYQDLSTLCPPSDDGKFKCYSSTQYVLCLGARSVVQAMAQGVPCVDRTGPGAAPPAPPPVATSPAPAPAPTPTSSLARALDTALPLPALSTAPAASTSTPAIAARTSASNYDPLRRGTRTSKSVVCSKTVRVLGISLENLFRCMDSSHYVTCKNTGPSDIFVVDAGWKCIQSTNGDGGVVGAA